MYICLRTLDVLYIFINITFVPVLKYPYKDMLFSCFILKKLSLRPWHCNIMKRDLVKISSVKMKNAK